MAGGHGETISVTLRVWREDGPDDAGRFDVHHQTISTDASFLEMLDLLKRSSTPPAKSRWHLRATAARGSAAHVA